jgi:hypothetical protein
MRKMYHLSAAILVCAPKLQPNILILSKIFRPIVQNKTKVIRLPPPPLGREKWNNFIEKRFYKNANF